MEGPGIRLLVIGIAAGAFTCGACNAISGVNGYRTLSEASDSMPDVGVETSPDGGCCPPGLFCSKTGCVGWAGWPMPNPPNDAGWPNVEDYDLSAEGAGIVKDRVTGLTWQRSLDVTGSGLSWSDARAYCSGLSLAGFTDWRLPTRIELVSILDFTHLPSIDGVAFPGTPNDDFWTSSTVAASTTKAWFVRFSTGSTGQNDQSLPHRVRCVR